MFHQLRLGIGASFIILGSLLAASGEIINILATDVLSSSWHLSLGLIIVGTFLLLIGFPLFTSVPKVINGFGLFGSYILFIGGLLLIIGTIVLDWILIPFLINLTTSLSSAVNGSTAQAQQQLNAIVSNLNNLGIPGLSKLLPGTAPRIPQVNATELTNSALAQLHLPTIDNLKWWGHFSLSGGTLIAGSVILGLALLRRYHTPIPAGILLILFALLNLLCQVISPLPSYFASITSVLLFLTLAWLAGSAWYSHSTQKELLHNEL